MKKSMLWKYCPIKLEGGPLFKWGTDVKRFESKKELRREFQEVFTAPLNVMSRVRFERCKLPY
jgi:hypothetical protein